MPILKFVVPIFLLLSLACAGEEPVSEEVKSELRMTIMNANAATIRAVRANDPKILSPLISGDLLESLSKSIGAAKERGTYAVSELQDLRWGDVRVRGNSAEVVTTERWQHTHYAVGTNKCVMVLPARDVGQTYHLEKTARGWTIMKGVDDPDNRPPTPGPCPA